MRFDRIPENTFQNLQLGAGILATAFAPESGEVAEDALVGATSGGVNFTATPTFSDFGEDIDNAPVNVKELKRLESWAVTMSGSFVTVDANIAKMLIGAADLEDGKVVPRNDLSGEDFADLWWIGDYSDKNSAESGGFVAIHMLNALSTGGFSIQSNNRGKGAFDFEFTGHYSIENQDVVPFEVYVKAGT